MMMCFYNKLLLFLYFSLPSPFKDYYNLQQCQIVLIIESASRTLLEVLEYIKSGVTRLAGQNTVAKADQII